MQTTTKKNGKSDDLCAAAFPASLLLDSPRNGDLFALPWPLEEIILLDMLPKLPPGRTECCFN